jgi:lipopolysaccharide transport system ATP-binding protein
MSNLAIKVEHLSKMYRLGEINNGTLWQDIQTWAAIKRKKEDPHSKIGENNYSGDKDHFWALKDISFDVKQGDRLGIIGKNGAGKSTLLKILSRITTLTEKKKKIKGKIASLLEVGTGFHGELSGRENIYINGAILGMKKRRIDELLDSIIDFSGIEKHIDTPVKRYSSGMYVRLAFAVAAHLDSDILIADEVLAVGDAEFQKKALGKMQDLSTGEGRTVLFVSHNMEAVNNLCNCGIILEEGKFIDSYYDIQKMTSYYLNKNLNYTDSLKWKNTGLYNELPYIPLSLELLEENGSEINSDISADKNYMVKFIFNAKEFIPNLIFYFVLSYDIGKPLFYTCPQDIKKDYKPVSGINTIYFKIPKNLLTLNEYYISLGLYIPNVISYMDQFMYEVAIKFNVSNIIREHPYGIPETIISPDIEWIFSNDNTLDSLI